MQGFNRIAALFTSLLKTIGLLELASKAIRVDDNEVVNDGNGRTNETVVNLSKNKKFRNLIYMQNIGAIKKPTFLTSNTKKVFNQLWLMFIKASIF